MTGNRMMRSAQRIFVPLSAELFRSETSAMTSRTRTTILWALLGDRLRLREEVEILATAGLRVGAGHVEAAERVHADERSRALAVQVEVAAEELPLAAGQPVA